MLIRYPFFLYRAYESSAEGRVTKPAVPCTQSGNRHIYTRLPVTAAHLFIEFSITAQHARGSSPSKVSEAAVTEEIVRFKLLSVAVLLIGFAYAPASHAQWGGGGSHWGGHWNHGFGRGCCGFFEHSHRFHHFGHRFFGHRFNHPHFNRGFYGGGWGYGPHYYYRGW